MKHTISIWFTLIATCLLVAHAVVPHHHHNKIPVALINMFDHDAEGVFNLHHGHGHHHDGDANHHDGQSHHHSEGDEECFISEAQMLPGIKLQLVVSKFFNGENKGYNLLSSFAKCFGNVMRQAPPIHLFLNAHYFRHKPYQARNYIGYVACATGLRAPPSC